MAVKKWLILSNNNKFAYLEAFLAVFFWSVYFPLAKNSLDNISVLSFATARFFFGFLTIFIFTIMKYRKQYFIKVSNYIKDPKIFLFIILSGFIGIFLHQFIQVEGISRTTAGNTAWILAFIPGITFVFSLVFLKEKANIIEIAGFIISFISVIYLTTGFKVNGVFGGDNIVLFGNLLVFGSCFTWSIYTVLNKKLLQVIKPLELLPMVFFTGLLFLILLNIIKGNNPVKELLANNFGTIFTVILTGIFPAGIGYIFWYDSLKKIGASRTTFFVYLEPFITMITASFLRGEVVLLSSIMAGVLITIGLLIMENDKKIYRLLRKRVLLEK